jgi:hypothetical protein
VRTGACRLGTVPVLFTLATVTSAANNIPNAKSLTTNADAEAPPEYTAAAGIAAPPLQPFNIQQTS